MPLINANKKTESSFNYVFPAIRGIQAGREYYNVMCPLKLVPKIFMLEKGEIPPTLRAQRTLNKSRVPEITKYILENNKEYIFSSLTASIDGAVKFKAIGKNNDNYKLGQLIVPMTSNFLINDGQHRRAAIEKALEEKPELGRETISLVLFLDAGLKRAQQMFADLNQNAIRPTRSLGILYNYRDKFARFTLRLVETVPIFKDLTELEKTTISHRSIKLFTLSSVYQANKALLGKTGKNPKLTEKEENTTIDYWVEVTKHVPEWKMRINGKLSSSDLRKKFVHAHGLALYALGTAGNSLIKKYPKKWKIILKKIEKINWSRSNTKVWEGRAMLTGKISKAHSNLVLTANLLKKTLGLSLTSEENRVEKQFAKEHIKVL